MIKHSQSAQINKFKISLQYLKKVVKDGIRFLHADNTLKQFVGKLGLKGSKLPQVHIIAFDRSGLSFPQYQKNRKLVIFLQYLKKKSVATAFVFYCDAKHSDILRGSSHVRCYLLILVLTFSQFPV